MRPIGPFIPLTHAKTQDGKVILGNAPSKAARNAVKSSTWRLDSSSPPSITLWQPLQETVPVSESRGSKNSFLPSSTFAAIKSVTTGINGGLRKATKSGRWSGQYQHDAPASESVLKQRLALTHSLTLRAGKTAEPDRFAPAQRVV